MKSPPLSGSMSHFIDHDALEGGPPDEATTRLPANDDVVYRGWLVQTRDYEALWAATSRRWHRSGRSASAYRRAHEFPGWYPAAINATPESYWTTGPSLGDFVGAWSLRDPSPHVIRSTATS